MLALDAFDKVLAGKIEPDIRQRAVLSRGEVLYFLKRPADALVALEPLATEGVPPEIRARALYYVGKINADSGNTDAAVKSLKTLIEALPENPLVPFARYQLAFVYLTRKETEDAALEFSAVAAAKADDALRM
ncbi:MAG: hypothetical protein NTU83_09685 [Candidatus Hydrogenedentes bacterium]|nr:hypothetical protein [Candidatus Hydrogenedentota bacterium]